jgi:hypothetical protein
MRIILVIGVYGFFRDEFSGENGYKSDVDNRALVWFWDLQGPITNPKTCMKTSKSVLMRKTIVFNLLLILGYYLILQLLVWLAMIFR